MEAPTESGFYLAYLDDRWQPVELEGNWISILGYELEVPKDMVTQWGEKIERREAQEVSL